MGLHIFRYQALIREHMEDLAASIVLEQGKTLPDARGDVLRGLQASHVLYKIRKYCLRIPRC